MSTQTVSTYAFPQLESPTALARSPADLIARAAGEADEIRERARAEGEAAGRAEGLEQARAQSAIMLDALAAATREVEQTLEATVEVLTIQAGELAILTAEQIIAGAIAATPERIVDVVRGALRRLAERRRVTVLVNPDDLDVLSGATASLQAQLGGIEHLEVQADRRVARGGAVARTVHGEIDASIAAQLQSARELVQAILAGDTDATRQNSSDEFKGTDADGVRP